MSASKHTHFSYKRYNGRLWWRSGNNLLAWWTTKKSIVCAGPQGAGCWSWIWCWRPSSLRVTRNSARPIADVLSCWWNVKIRVFYACFIIVANNIMTMVPTKCALFACYYFLFNGKHTKQIAVIHQCDANADHHAFENGKKHARLWVILVVCHCFFQKITNHRCILKIWVLEVN